MFVESGGNTGIACNSGGVEHFQVLEFNGQQNSL
jgi:hypothetical protein